jgi:serine phosphatase RsbU (regulator of sigma subunit)
MDMAMNADSADTPTGRDVRVLLIEDNPGDARLVQLALAEIEQPAYQLVWKSSLAEAVAELENATFDVVISDLSLPDSSGLDTISQIRIGAQDTPLVVLTGLDDEATGLRAVQAGAQDFLVKGQINATMLSRALRYAIERFQVLDELRRSRESLQKTTADLEKAIQEINEELDMARIVQTSLLPRTLGPTTGLVVAGSYHPSTLLGGDLYDVISIDENRVALLIFDVSGHGAAASLVSAMAKVAFSRHIPTSADPAEVFSKVNTELVGVLHHMFLTAFLGVYDRSTRQFTYSSAGHPASMVAVPTSREIEYLKIRCPFIGLFDGSAYAVGRITLVPGARVVMFTDGLVESIDKGGVPYGRLRLAASIIAARTETPEVLVTRIHAAHREFVKDEPVRDDVTLLVFGVD